MSGALGGACVGGACTVGATAAASSAGGLSGLLAGAKVAVAGGALVAAGAAGQWLGGGGLEAMAEAGTPFEEAIHNGRPIVMEFYRPSCEQCREVWVRACGTGDRAARLVVGKVLSFLSCLTLSTSNRRRLPSNRRRLLSTRRR